MEEEQMATHDIMKKELSAVKSFNNKSLQENYEIALKSIDKIEVDLGNKHDRSHSQFAWKHFILDQFTNGRNLRQILAEIDRKKRALVDNKYGLLKDVAQTKIKEDLLKGETNEYKRKLLQLEIEESYEKNKMAIRPIQGALKDIMVLTDVYEQIKTEMSEEEFEKEEKKYWIMRLVAQSTRDVRSTSKIGNGNQEALEQCGLNPLAVELDIIKYLGSELKDISYTTERFNKFLEESAEKYNGYIDTSLKIRGIDGNIVNDALFKEEKK